MTYMYERISASDFYAAFKRMDRLTGWTYDGLKALYDYLEETAEDTGEPIELDVISLCCDFSEVADMDDFQKEYGSDDYKTVDDVENETTVIRIPDSDGFIYQAF